jgi:hypothetical protein
LIDGRNPSGRKPESPFLDPEEGKIQKGRKDPLQRRNEGMASKILARTEVRPVGKDNLGGHTHIKWKRSLLFFVKGIGLLPLGIMRDAIGHFGIEKRMGERVSNRVDTERLNL